MAEIEKVPVQKVPKTCIMSDVKLEELTCPICTDEFERGEEVRVLPCNTSHIFHKDCIDPWLIKVKKCPL